ncbi:uncharacterized protein LOC121731859, partial [Aricia agestis]|uniref:uncharacterized protein LOC121731859 n=1 Tax=Aricia agestis TaxID=91739 RepID=UPI001C203D2F
IKNRFTVTSAENILWLINLTPQSAGFSILKENNSERRKVEYGVPQGSRLDVSCFDWVLRCALLSGMVLVCYCDHTYVLFREKTFEEAARLAEVGASLIVSRIEWLGFRVRLSKPETAKLFRGPGRRGPPPGARLLFREIEVRMSPTLKCLGLILDRRWTFGPHFQQLGPKVERAASALGQPLPNIGGPSKACKRLYSGVCRSIALYGALIWADSLTALIFWTAHFILLFYIFFLSNVVMEIRGAYNVRDIIKANTILSVIIMILSTDYWFLTKRKLLVSTLDKLLAVDAMSQESEAFRENHTKFLTYVKRVVVVFYTVNFLNTTFVYFPQRINFTSAFSTFNQCPGIDASAGITRHVCRAIALSQDLTIVVVVMNYQALLIFTIAHTTCMYRMIAKEMADLKNRRDIKERLPGLIKRHGLLMDIIRRLRSLYNMPIGINFGTNAYCICLYFSLPLDQINSFIPVLCYNILVFFLYCYLCQKLIDSSIAFEQAVYDCGWESYDLADMKTVYIVLKLAQKPVSLSAADMVPVNIYTFATAAEFMFKLITVLKF